MNFLEIDDDVLDLFGGVLELGLQLLHVGFTLLQALALRLLNQFLSLSQSLLFSLFLSQFNFINGVLDHNLLLA
jgi:hypothetical protein